MAGDETAIALIKRYDTLFGEQASMRMEWQDIADYYLPHKANIIKKRQQGQEQRDHLFTGAGTRAGKRLAANLHGSLTSQALPWFTWKDEDEEVNKDLSMAQWYETATQIGYKAFHGPMSNFNTQQHEFYIDLVFFATAAKLFEIVTGPKGEFSHFAFKTIQIGSFVFDENIFGFVDFFTRRFDMSIRNAVAKFGEDALPDKLKKDWNAKQPDKKYPFLQVCMPAEEYEKFGGKADKPFPSIFISVEGQQRVKEESYFTFPFMVARWDKASGELNGSGPAMDSKPDLKSLNTTREQKLDAAGMAIRPPMQADDDGVVGDYDLTPGGITITRPNATFKPIFMGSDLRIATLTEDDLRKEINESFFYEDLNLPTGRQMTAEEVIQRIEILQRLLGPTLGRLESEDLNPMTRRGFLGLLQAGAFPPLPEGMEPSKLSVRYEGPLARAQRAVQVEAMMKTRTIAERIATLNPEVMDLLDDDKELLIAADILGYPKHALRKQKVVDQRRKDRKDQQAAQAMPQQLKDLGQGAKNFTTAFKDMPTNGVVPGPVGVAGA